MQKRRRFAWKRLWPVLVIVVAYTAWALLRPLPLIKPDKMSTDLQFDTGSPALAWPNAQSAVGIVGTTVLATHGDQKPAPTASTAKIITALMVIKQKPLATGQQGPVITLTTSDQALYNSYVTQGGSTVPVHDGEQITEYQMLEGMLLPSANNMADSLAIWAYGSLPAYSSAANAYLKQLGLVDTTVGSDASGFNPSTVSTARDLVKLGELVMQNPVLAEIVNKAVATDVPMAPEVKNVNFLLGNSGVVGIKTGNTDQAGGVFVGAVRTDVNQKPVTVVTALVGAPTLFQSIQLSLPLLQSVQANFQNLTPVHANDIVGNYKVPWGDSIPVAVSRNLTVTSWKGSSLKANLKLPNLDQNARSDQALSQLNMTEPITGTKSSTPVNLQSDPGVPSLMWRLTHPY